MSESLYAGLTSQTIDVLLYDSSSTTGAGLTGLVYNSSGLSCYYRKGATGSATSITLATQTVGGSWSSGGFVQIDATNMPGVYRFDVPNAVVDSEGFATVYFSGATNLVPTAIRVDCRPIPSDLKKIQTDAQSVTDLKDFADAGYDPATNKVQGVVLVDTTTTNTDMRGTDSAFLAANAPTNFSDLAITSTTGQVDIGLVLGTALTETSAGNLADNFSFFYDLDTTTTNTVDDVGGGSGLDAAGVRAAIGLASANLDTQLEDIPTVSEFNARTIASADYFDPTSDTVTVGTNNDKTGYALTSGERSSIADAVWDEDLTGHTTADTAGLLMDYASNVTASGSIVSGITDFGFVSNLTNATEDIFNDQVLVFTSGVLNGIARIITNYSGSSKSITFDELLPAAPSVSDTFVIYGLHTHTKDQIADTVWGEATVGNTTNGTFGYQLKTVVDAVLADTDELQANQGNWLTATGFSTHSAADVRTEMDSNSTQLAAIVADTDELQTNQGDWATADVSGLATAAALATVDANVDSILVDTGTSIPATLTTILADTNELQTNQGNWITADVSGLATSAALATVDSNVNAILVDTGTTIPGTITTLDTNMDAVKAVTDQINFGVAGQIDANVESINTAAVNGSGTSGDKWRGS